MNAKKIAQNTGTVSFDSREKIGGFVAHFDKKRSEIDTKQFPFLM